MHAACVELLAHDDATIKYSTIQNWYPGDKNGKGGIYNFVTKREIVLERTLVYLGLKLRQVQLLHGNIQAVY